MYNPVSSDVTGWKIHHSRVFFGFDPEATGRNPKNHMVETKITWFGTWLLFFYIYIIIHIYIYMGMS